MKTRLVRCLLLVFAAVFFANNVAYAARAGLSALAEHEHALLGHSNAAAVAHECPSADDPGICLIHCTQGFKNSEQKVMQEIPGVPLAPGASLSHPPFRVESAGPVAALLPHFVGPPLTILFRNFRN